MKRNSGKDPSFQFYWKDWLSDTKLMGLSKRAKGVWIDLMCISCDMEVPGVFFQKNSALTRRELVEKLTGSARQNSADIETLLRQGILRQFPDNGDYPGAFYVKRIYQDMKIRKARSDAGKRGGNPNLVNQKCKQKVESCAQNDNQTVNQNPTPSTSTSTSYTTTPFGSSSITALDNHNNDNDSRVLSRFHELVEFWNSFGPEPVKDAELMSLEPRYVALVTGVPPNRFSHEEIMAAMANYKRAREFPGSQTYPHSLGKFLVNTALLTKFLPGVFNLPDHDGSRFNKTGNERNIPKELEEYRERKQRFLSGQ
jgi:hypothetical protein